MFVSYNDLNFLRSNGTKDTHAPGVKFERAKKFKKSEIFEEKNI